MIDNQHVYDTVVLHLVRQGCQAREEEGLCLYRTADGKSCAVGCLIADCDYRPDMEGDNAYELERVFGLFKGYDIGLLDGLQDCHDRTESWDEDGLSEYGWGLLASVAQRFSLQPRDLAWAQAQLEDE